MVYSPAAPYEVLQTGAVDFATMQRMRRFSRYWDLLANSGNFRRTLPTVWAGGASPFASFLALSDWLHGREGRSHAIALPRLAELLFAYLTEVRRREPAEVAPPLWDDVRGDGRRDGPEFLKPFVSDDRLRDPRRRLANEGLPKRQSRHLRVP
jgi:hypothetical protein